MVDWREMGFGSIKAAKELLKHRRDQPDQTDDFLRSSISRAYYAVFSITTAELLHTNVNFKPGWEGPTHTKLPQLARNNLKNLSVRDRRDLCTIIRRLYLARIDADYTPGATIDRTLAFSVLHQAILAFKFLGISL
jgi:uncharacterized protein (UPF0332 family)